MQNSLISFLLSILGFSCAFAQSGVIRGKVISAENNNPIPYATVQLDVSEGGTSTDKDGNFILVEVPEGEISINVRSLGYQEVNKSMVIPPEDTLYLNISMLTANVNLSEIVVTGTMRETHIKDSPVKIDVVNIEHLEKSKTSSNFMDLIGSVNGLSTQLNCGVCGTNAIRINGVEGPNTAVLIDGMPVMGALASVYGLNGISPSIISRVEVIKGPQSTLYGTQALGGVVNIITKNPANTPNLMTSAYFESGTRESSINMAVSPDMGRFKGFVSGDFTRNQHYFDKNGDGFNDIPKQNRYALFMKGIMEGKDGGQRLNVAAKFLKEDRTGGVRSFTDDLRGSDQIYGESIYTSRGELLGEFRPSGLNERLRIKGALTYHDQDSYYGDSKYAATQRITFGQVSWDQYLTESIRLLTGASMRYESYDDSTPATAQGADQRLIPGVFAQGELRSGRFTFLGGMRLDHQSRHGFVTAPRLSVKYSPSDLTTFRVSSGTGFRIVNVFTEDHAALTGSREVVFKENLDPERSKSITASIDQIIPFTKDLIKVTLDGFYTRFSNKIIPDYDQDPNSIVYENLNGFSVTRGFSINIDQNFVELPLGYNASFTLMDVFSSEDGFRQAVPYAPDYLGNVDVDYRIHYISTSIGYSANIMGSKRMPDNYVVEFGRPRQSPVYSTHDVKITTELSNVNGSGGRGIEVFLSVENLFDFSQGSPLVAPEDPFSPAFDTIYTWGPIVGRTFQLGARWVFE